MFNEIRGMSIQERSAVARALQVGYITKSVHVGYQAVETWYSHCAKTGIPYVSIGNRGLLKVVIVDLDTVRSSYSPMLAPTAKARLRLQQIVSRYKAVGEYGGSYTYLKNIAASHAPLMAKELIVLWNDNKRYATVSSLWDVVTMIVDEGVA